MSDTALASFTGAKRPFHESAVFVMAVAFICLKVYGGLERSTRERRVCETRSSIIVNGIAFTQRYESYAVSMQKDVQTTAYTSRRDSAFILPSREISHPPIPSYSLACRSAPAGGTTSDPKARES